VGYGMVAPGQWSANVGQGLFLDDFVSKTASYGNILVRNKQCGVLIHGGADNVVENNIMGAGIPSTYNHIRPEDELCNNRIIRNIVYYANADPRLVLLYGWTVKGVTETASTSAAVPVFLCGWSSVKAAVAESDHNLFYPISGQEIRTLLVYRGVNQDFFGPWAQSPVEDRFTWWRSQGYEAHSIIGDPLFMDAANEDFRLKPESPAFNLGFKPIPVERIGLYASPNRATWPVPEHHDIWREQLPFPQDISVEPRVAKPKRPRPELRVAQGTAGIVVDGDGGEWPWDDLTRMVVLEQSYTGFPTDAPKSYACAAYDDEALYIAIRNLVGDPQRLKLDGEWGGKDGLEIPFQDISGEKPGPILNLYGYPDGQFATVTDAPTPPELAQKLADTVAYAAQIGAEDWTCEWKIPWGATGIDPSQAKKLWFNIGVYKSAKDAWVVWEGTGAGNYMLHSAGDLILLP